MRKKLQQKNLNFFEVVPFLINDYYEPFTSHFKGQMCGLLIPLNTLLMLKHGRV
jgi:hypothetical protein